jgi:hypothetical protein
MAVRCWMLVSWLFHSSLVSGGNDKTRLMVSLGRQSACIRHGVREEGALPNLENPLSLGPSPDADDVLAVPDTEHNAANLLTGLAELVTNDGEQQILPVAVRNALPQAHDPLASVLVLLVLPYWANALFEEMVIRDQGKCRGPLQVLVYRKEVLCRIARGDRVQCLFVFNEPIRLRNGRAKPKDPAVAELVARCGR